MKQWIALIGAGLGLLLTGCNLSGSSAEISSAPAIGETLPMTTDTTPPGKEIATFAGGCFWCTEAIFSDLKGVESVTSGYSGGRAVNPSYEDVCSGSTGHAEAVQIVFDPRVIRFRDLLDVFFTLHDPTTLNRQGADSGTQYRSAVFYHTKDQEQTAREVIHEFDQKHIWSDPIVTEVTPFHNFYPAEDYHQEYFKRNGSAPYCQIVIAPKVAKLREKFRDELKR